VVTLERNYRSTQAILAASNAVIGLAAERFTKNLWSHRQSAEKPQLVTVADDLGQVRYIVDKILENREAGIALKAQAVLFRTSSHSGALEVELTRRNIPFVKFGGLKFLEAAHIKDVLAFLHWAQNPRDRVAGFRVLQLMPGIGPATAARVLDHLLATAELRDFNAPAAAAAAWPDFADTIESVRRNEAGWPAELETICRWYTPHLERAYEDAVLRQADLAQLTHIAASYQSRERFLTEMKLDPPDATSDEAGPPLLDEDYLILSTIHSAKGQEWKAVFVLNTVDGCIPSDLSVRTPPEIEEERRLLYVAMTRAKDQLHLMVPQRFFVHQQRGLGDRHVYAQRTRFIPPAILKLFELRAWPPAAAEQGAAKPAAGSADVRGKLRRMWG
jgi:DNA helicase-2/ATP-dependent DNA helicase PcrA